MSKEPYQMFPPRSSTFSLEGVIGSSNYPTFPKWNSQPVFHCAHRANTDLSKLISLSFQRVAWSILECVRRTSTFLSCAIREQEDDQAARLFLFHEERL